MWVSGVSSGWGQGNGGVQVPGGTGKGWCRHRGQVEGDAGIGVYQYQVGGGWSKGLVAEGQVGGGAARVRDQAT